VRDVRRVEVANALAIAEGDGLAVEEHARRTRRHVVQRHHASRGAMRHLGARRHGEPVVHRAALVRLVVAERDPAQPLRVDQPRESLTHQREHVAVAGMKEQRLVAKDDELVESEAGRGCDLRHKGREPVDAVGDFADAGFHDRSPFGIVVGNAGRREPHLVIHACVAKSRPKLNWMHT
jgi:hypothetical protein